MDPEKACLKENPKRKKGDWTEWIHPYQGIPGYWKCKDHARKGNRRRNLHQKDPGRSHDVQKTASQNGNDPCVGLSRKRMGN